MTTFICFQPAHQSLTPTLTLGITITVIATGHTLGQKAKKMLCHIVLPSNMSMLMFVVLVSKPSFLPSWKLCMYVWYPKTNGNQYLTGSYYSIYYSSLQEWMHHWISAPIQLFSLIGQIYSGFGFTPPHNIFPVNLASIGLQIKKFKNVHIFCIINSEGGENIGLWRKGTLVCNLIL